MQSIDPVLDRIIGNISQQQNPFGKVIQKNPFGTPIPGKTQFLLWTGSFGKIEQYDMLQAALAARGYSGSSISYPGHFDGAQAADVKNYELTDYVESMVYELFLSYTSTDRLYLVGHSMGAKVIYLVLEVLQCLREKGIAGPTIESIALLAPSPNASSAMAGIKTMIQQPYATLLSVVSVFNNTRLIQNPGNARSVFFSDNIELRDVEAQLDKLTFESPKAVQATLSSDFSLPQNRLAELVADISVLILGCTSDRLVNAETIQSTAGQLAAAKAIEVEFLDSDYGHMFLWDPTLSDSIVDSMEALLKIQQ